MFYLFDLQHLVGPEEESVSLTQFLFLFEKSDTNDCCFQFNSLTCRGDNGVIGIVLELGRQGLLRVDAMAAASEDDVTSIVQRHSKNIDARWMIPLAAELIAVHRGIMSFRRKASYCFFKHWVPQAV